MKYLLLSFIFLFFLNTNVLAASDPRLFPNNKFGINSLSPEAEVNDVADLVNTNGDWGWVVLVIRKNERDTARWQAVFNSLLKNHLTPVVRIATLSDSQGNWERPSAQDAQDWANFLAGLSWPTKNRYVQIYNEVNRKTEWGGSVDAGSYSLELDRTIDALKAKSQDFFVLNSPLDLAAGNVDGSLDAGEFFKSMNDARPGIFDKLDGWASHSYPNPGFSASPLKSGRTGIDGYKWELAQISTYTTKNLPVFITETGWRNSGSGPRGLTEADIADYYKTAFNRVWNDSRVVVVAPFVFNYPDILFRAFSFKIGDSCLQFCLALKDFFKVKGEPERVDTGQILALVHAHEVINNSISKISLAVKNNGNYIWDTKNQFKIDVEALGMDVRKISWNSDNIYPGQVAKATIDFNPTKEGTLPFVITVINNNEVLALKESTVLSETYFALILNSLRSVLARS